MKKLDAKGFGAIEAILMVVILGVICGAGFLVYKSQNETKTSLNNTANSQIEPDKTVDKVTTKDITKDWTEYKSIEGGYTIKIPDGWELTIRKDTTNLSGDCSSTTVCVTYKEGIKGIVKATEGGRGGPFRFALTHVLDVENIKDIQRGEKVTYSSLTTYPTEKFKYTPTKDEPMDVPVGGKEYSYYIKKDNKALKITYSTFSLNEKDESNIVDLMVATIKL